MKYHRCGCPMPTSNFEFCEPCLRDIGIDPVQELIDDLCGETLEVDDGDDDL